MGSTETGRIERLSEIFAPETERAAGRVLLGIGDDAAVIATCPEPMVWTVDAAVEGVHFRRAWLSFEDVGYRLTMAAASDIAAMGAEPVGALAALVLPDDVGDAELFALARGQREAAGALGTVIAGGNLSRGGELSITTTVLGRTPRALVRSGARPGDALWLLGPVGLAAAGLRLLMGGRPLDAPAARACVDAWRRPRARIAEGIELRGLATAAIDVSDGLARDAGHLARASHARVVIDAAAIEAAPWSETLRAAAALLGTSAVDLALHGGEDYALAFAAPRGASIEGAIAIGRFEETSEGDPVAEVLGADGTRARVTEGGFDHFAKPEP